MESWIGTVILAMQDIRKERFVKQFCYLGMNCLVVRIQLLKFNSFYVVDILSISSLQATR